MSGYTRQEVAQRAGVDPDYLDRLVELGILTPAAAHAFSPGDALRARWLQSLERAGVPLEGLAAAVRDGALSFSFLDPRPACSTQPRNQQPAPPVPPTNSPHSCTPDVPNTLQTGSP